MPEMESLQGEGSVFYTCLCKKADKWPTWHWTGLFLQAAATATMQCQPKRCSHFPPIPPLLLTQNLSSKQNVPTDKKRPKTDAKRHHQLKSYFCWAKNTYVNTGRYQYVCFCWSVFVKMYSLTCIDTLCELLVCWWEKLMVLGFWQITCVNSSTE